MKDNDKKHRKGQESTIGKIIYGFLLFMPLIAIGSALLISTFNMSAKEETTYNTQFETNQVNNDSDLIVGNIYKFKANTTINDSATLFYTNYLYIPDLENFEYQVENNTYFQVYYANTNNYIYIYNYDNTNRLMITRVDINNIEFYAVYINSNGTLFNSFDKTKSDYLGYITDIDTHNVNTQNVFYNAVDKVTESPLFNWTTNSIIYTTTNNTCNALSITTPIIPLLLAYWLIISVIYFLYDIALMLVWIIHSKIHELQESL